MLCILDGTPQKLFSPLVLSPLFLALFHLVSFFSLHSLLFISFAFLLSLLVHVYAHIERGKFCQSALYLRRASTSNGFDVLSDATRVPVPRGVRVHTHAHTHTRARVGRFLMRARACLVCMYTGACTSRSRDARYGV